MCARVGQKLRHSLEANKYPYVSPYKVELKYTDDLSDTARYPLVKAHGLLIHPLACLSYTHGTRSRNRHRKLTPFSGASFWYVCHVNLGPDSSGTRFRRRTVLFQARNWRARD